MRLCGANSTSATCLLTSRRYSSAWPGSSGMTPSWRVPSGRASTGRRFFARCSPYSIEPFPGSAEWCTTGRWNALSSFSQTDSSLVRAVPIGRGRRSCLRRPPGSRASAHREDEGSDWSAIRKPYPDGPGSRADRDPGAATFLPAVPLNRPHGVGFR